MTTIDYSKYILNKVSFDSILFKKELSKLIYKLDFTDREDLLLWCEENHPQLMLLFTRDHLKHILIN